MALIQLLLAFSLRAHAAETEFRVARDAQRPMQPLRVAVVFGLNGKIGSSEDIVSAERSAIALAKTLHTKGFDVLKVITGPDATAARLRQVLKAAEQMNLGEQDTLLVAAITHGGRCIRTREEGPVQQLRVVETRASDQCWENAITDKELLELLRASGAGLRMLYIDACNTQLSSMGVSGMTGPLVRPEEEVVLRSAAPGGAAYASREYTLYTQAFIDALNDPSTDTDGDGAVTAQEASSATYERVYRSSGGQQMTSQSVNASGPTNRVVLVGTPSTTQRSVLSRLPAGVWALGETPQDFNVPNDLVVTGEGVLTGRDNLGVSIRIFGVPRQPGRHDASTWVAGRRRGPPSLVVAGGVQGLRISEDSALDEVLTAGGGQGPAVWVGAHQVVTPGFALGSNIYIQDKLPALTFSAVSELNVRSWTGGLGLSGGWLRFGVQAGDGATTDGQTLHLGGLVGGHAEVRRGVRPELALMLAADAGMVLGGPTDHELNTPNVELFPAPWASVRAGVLWDPGVVHHERGTR